MIIVYLNKFIKINKPQGPPNQIHGSSNQLKQQASNYLQNFPRVFTLKIDHMHQVLLLRVKVLICIIRFVNSHLCGNFSVFISFQSSFVFNGQVSFFTLYQSFKCSCLKECFNVFCGRISQSTFIQIKNNTTFFLLYCKV